MKRGLIPDRIAFASKVDVTSCRDVQSILQALVNHESYQKWCETEERRELRPDNLMYPTANPIRSLTAVIP